MRDAPWVVRGGNGYRVRTATHAPAADAAATVTLTPDLGEYAVLKKLLITLKHGTAAVPTTLTIAFGSTSLVLDISGFYTTAPYDINFPDGLYPITVDTAITITVAGQTGNTAKLIALWQ